MVTTTQQPVPFVYFHVLKLMMMVVNAIIGYELVNVFGEYSWTLSVTIFATTCAMLLGLQEIAGVMADPFGSDDTDFDTQRVCADAYNNAVAYMRTQYKPGQFKKPRFNPILENRRASYLSREGDSEGEGDSEAWSQKGQGEGKGDVGC